MRSTWTTAVARRLPSLLVLLALCWSGTTAVAAAQEAGVTVDPDSPAGREYAIPLDSARSAGDDGSKSRSQAPGEDSSTNADSELFGEGIAPASGSQSGTSTSSSQSGGTASTTGNKPNAGSSSEERGATPSDRKDRRSRHDSAAGAAGGGGTPPSAAQPARAAASSDGGGSSFGSIVLPIVGVLLLGGVIAIVLRIATTRSTGGRQVGDSPAG